jgi:hypothetical protein
LNSGSNLYPLFGWLFSLSMSSKWVYGIPHNSISFIYMTKYSIVWAQLDYLQPLPITGTTLINLVHKFLWENVFARYDDAIPALRRVRQQDQRFKASPGYTVSIRPAWAMFHHPVWKKPKLNKTENTFSFLLGIYLKYKCYVIWSTLGLLIWGFVTLCSSYSSRCEVKAHWFKFVFFINQW